MSAPTAFAAGLLSPSATGTMAGWESWRLRIHGHRGVRSDFDPRSPLRGAAATDREFAGCSGSSEEPVRPPGGALPAGPPALSWGLATQARLALATCNAFASPCPEGCAGRSPARITEPLLRDILGPVAPESLLCDCVCR